MDVELMLCRALHYTTSLIGFGIMVFQAALAPPGLRRALDRPLQRLAVTAAIIAAITSVFWLLLLAAGMAEEPDGLSIDVVSTVLFDTQFGSVWQWHMGLSILLAIAAGFLQPRWRWPVAAGIAALQLGSLGLIGHAVMPQGLYGIVSRIAQTSHLLAAGYWLGCLVPVVQSLGLQTADLKRDVVVALTRFSNAGHGVVALVIATGLVSMDLTTGRMTLYPSTTYQALLDVKIAIVAAMTLLALVNRYWLVPRVKREPAAMDLIRRNSVGIFGLGIAAVTLVSIFGMLSPT